MCLSENPERGSKNTFEVDFFRDPNGLLDLERICYHKIQRIHNQAIHDFINYSINNFNSGYSFYNDVYLAATKEFVQNLLEYSDEYSNGYTCYFAKRMSVKEFRAMGGGYIDMLLKNASDKEFVAVDNLMSINDSDSDILRDYFGNFLRIWNYSDPRDIYARARLSGPQNDWVPVDPKIFVKNWMFMYASIIKNPGNCTKITNFDVFCNNYEKTANDIISFCGLDKNMHTDKFKYFDPKKSIANTVVYPRIENQKAIEYIYKNLHEFCYEV